MWNEGKKERLLDYFVIVIVDRVMMINVVATYFLFFGLPLESFHSIS